MSVQDEMLRMRKVVQTGKTVRHEQHIHRRVTPAPIRTSDPSPAKKPVKRPTIEQETDFASVQEGPPVREVPLDAVPNAVPAVRVQNASRGLPAKELRRAVILSEILAPPVSRRK